MRQALIVSHGSPSEPAEQDAAMVSLCARVGKLLPEWNLLPATLASYGSLESALKTADPSHPLLIYPFFMADGWFVVTELRRRIADGPPAQPIYLDPVGLDPGLPEMCARLLKEDCGAAGFDPKETSVILAAHGSPSHKRPGEVARLLAQAIDVRTCFKDVRVGFVDEDPRIADVLKDAGQSVCLPLFALRAGHVLVDLTAAVAEAGFGGRILDPIGEHPNVPQLVANALQRTAEARLISTS